MSIHYLKHFFLLFILTVVNIFATSSDLLMAEVSHYNKTATSLNLKDAKLNYNASAISYMRVHSNYLLLGTFKYMPKQHIGTSALGSTPLKLEQKAWKYEFGAAYKFYLHDDLFIAPALLYSDYYNTLYQTLGDNTIETRNRDADTSFYGLLGYKATNSTIFFAAIELDNDILSDNYADDYSQYMTTITLYQFLSKKWFVRLKYQQTLRDKEARSDSTGNKDTITYGFGVGMKF